MNRAAYSDDGEDNWGMIRWRGAVASAMRGKRGQAFLREMLAVLDAMPEKRLIAYELECEGEVCAIGSVGRQRSVDMSRLDPEDYSRLSGVFGIAEPLVREIEYMNDEGTYLPETPEQRWRRMRDWVASCIPQVGTHPKGGDSLEAPAPLSDAVAEGHAPEPSPSNPQSKGQG